jgi:hypothetical protein
LQFAKHHASFCKALEKGHGERRLGSSLMADNQRLSLYCGSGTSSAQ